MLLDLELVQDRTILCNYKDKQINLDDIQSVLGYLRLHVLVYVQGYQLKLWLKSKSKNGYWLVSKKDIEGFKKNLPEDVYDRIKYCFHLATFLKVKCPCKLIVGNTHDQDILEKFSKI